MTAFWIAAALITAGTLLLVVPPLWQSGGATVRRETLLISAFVAFVAAGGYAWFGRPGTIEPGRPVAPPVPGTLPSPEQVQQMVAALAERLRRQPDDAAGWARLGRSYVVLGRLHDAAIALRRAAELRPADAHLLSDLADVLALTRGKRFAGEPAALVQRALDADPRHPKALSLAGSVAFEAHDYAAARAYWERLLALLEPDSSGARSVRGSIAQASALAAAASASMAQNAPGSGGTR